MQEQEKINAGQPKEHSAPYYSKRPKFGDKGPSKIRQHFSQGLTIFLVIATCVLFYFALLRLSDISRIIGMVVDVLKPILYGLAIAYLLNPIVKQVDKYLEPLLEKKLSKKRAMKISRAVGVIAALIFLVALVVALCNMLIPEL